MSDWPPGVKPEPSRSGGFCERGSKREALNSPQKFPARRVSFNYLPGACRVKLPYDSALVASRPPSRAGLRAAASKEAWQHDVHEAEDLLRPVHLPAWHTPQLGEERLQSNPVQNFY